MLERLDRYARWARLIIVSTARIDRRWRYILSNLFSVFILFVSKHHMLTFGTELLSRLY